jgi:dihydroorotate dehydrogenase electron transfer subunit
MPGLPLAPVAPEVFEARFLAAEPASADGYVLRLEPLVREGATDALPAPGPSQFYMLSLPERLQPLLPRPFSIYRTEAGELHFLVKRQGPATRAYEKLAPGDRLRLVGPLGATWPEPDPLLSTVLVAGGVGLAPFPLWIERALARGVPPERIRLVFGARDARGLYDLARLRAYGVALELCTEDASVGARGRVTDLLAAGFASGTLDGSMRFFVCGPDPMMAAVKRFLDARGAERAAGPIAAWFSLETYMACGLGVCNGCAVPVEPACHGEWPYAKACLHGPVFASEVLQSSALEGAHG